MTHHAKCPRCHLGELVSAAVASPEAMKVVVEAGHASPVAARVCPACGHIELVATRPRALRPGESAEHEVQEYDF